MSYEDSEAQVKSAQVRSEDHSVVIDISQGNNLENKKYYCSHCNPRLIPFTQEDKKGGYLCVKCQIEYWPKQQPVKKPNRFETPGPATNEHGDILGDIDIPMVAMNMPEPSTTSKIKLPEAYEALRKNGFAWTSYEEKRVVELQSNNSPSVNMKSGQA